MKQFSKYPTLKKKKSSTSLGPSLKYKPHSFKNRAKEDNFYYQDKFRQPGVDNTYTDKTSVLSKTLKEIDGNGRNLGYKKSLSFTKFLRDRSKSKPKGCEEVSSLFSSSGVRDKL